MIEDVRWSGPSSWSLEPLNFSPQPCQYIQFVCYEDGSVVHGSGRLEAGEISSWLSDWLLPETPSNPIISTTRIILCQEYTHNHFRASLPFSRDDFHAMVQDWDMPLRSFTSVLGYYLQPGHEVTKNGQSWFIRDDLFSLAISHRRLDTMDSNVGFVIAKPSHYWRSIDTIVEQAIAKKNNIMHPLCLFGLLCDGALDDHRAIAIRRDRECNDILRSFGPAFNFVDAPRPPNERMVDDPAENLDRTAVALEQISRHWRIVSGFDRCLKSLERWHKQYADEVFNLSENSTRKALISTKTKQFAPLIQDFISASAGILTDLQATETRLLRIFPVVQLQLTRRDTELSLRLAQTATETAVASKRDSSSMKIIAVLTTFFLPGTFVATYIGTPMYKDDWTSDDVGRYWAITIPLTAVIMVMVAFWIWRNSTANKRADAQTVKDAWKDFAPKEKDD